MPHCSYHIGPIRLQNALGSIFRHVHGANGKGQPNLFPDESRIQPGDLSLSPVTCEAELLRFETCKFIIDGQRVCYNVEMLQGLLMSQTVPTTYLAPSTHPVPIIFITMPTQQLSYYFNYAIGALKTCPQVYFLILFEFLLPSKKKKINFFWFVFLLWTIPNVSSVYASLKTFCSSIYQSNIDIHRAIKSGI